MNNIEVMYSFDTPSSYTLLANSGVTEEGCIAEARQAWLDANLADVVTASVADAVITNTGAAEFKKIMDRVLSINGRLVVTWNTADVNDSAKRDVQLLKDKLEFLCQQIGVKIEFKDPTEMR